MSPSTATVVAELSRVVVAAVFHQLPPVRPNSLHPGPRTLPCRLLPTPAVVTVVVTVAVMMEIVQCASSVALLATSLHDAINGSTVTSLVLVMMTLVHRTKWLWRLKAALLLHQLIRLGIWTLRRQTTSPETLTGCT
jgi:hypothetical protein